MRLVDAELRRYAARRVVLAWLCVALVGVAVGATVAAARSEVRTDIFYGPDFEPFEVEVDDRFDLAADLPDVLAGAGFPLVLVGLFLGASFLGAEFGAASLSTQLVFEPRRARVLATKALAAAIGAAAFTTLVLVATGLGLAAVAATRGVVADLDASWWLGRAGDAGRVAAAAALAAGLGIAITALARRTVAAVVGVLGFGLVLEPVLVQNFDAYDGRLPMNALLAATSRDPDVVPGFPDHGAAFVVLAAWVIVIGVLALVDFRRREIR